jgi:hypothetical protein
MLSALSAAGADHIVVGGYAVGLHLEPRATKDIDILVRPSLANAKRVIRALRAFGAPLFGIDARLLSTAGLVLQIGVPPRRIDLLTALSGVSFAEAWRSRVMVPVEGLAKPVPFLGRETLIKNKRAAGRPQDLADVANLERIAPKQRGRRKRPRVR